MKLISSKKTKRRIALMFVFAFMLSNLLTLLGPTNAQAASTSQPSAGTCFQHTGSVASGAIVSIYEIGSIQISLLASEISPGQDATSTTAAATAAIAQATGVGGDIDDAGDIIGNIFVIQPPTGTNFTIVPGFQNTSATSSNLLAGTNAQISNAFSQESTNAGVDSTLDVDVGVVTAGTIALGQAIVAIARDADQLTATTNKGSETYPKSGTSGNTVTITINGLGLAIPPKTDQTLTEGSTLSATLSSSVPSGTGASGGSNSPAVASAVAGLTNTIPLCVVTSPFGKVEAVLDTDNDSGELYDKSGTASQNLLALGQIGTNTTVAVFDTSTVAAGVASSSLCDLEPIIIKGTGTILTGKTSTDQVIATSDLASDIDSDAEFPSAAGLTISTTFGNASGTGSGPITIAFEDDNSTAMVALQAVDIIISQSTAAGGAGQPTITGFSGSQSARLGFLGALRAALFEGGDVTSLSDHVNGTSWGIVSLAGTGAIAIQETTNPSIGTRGLGIGGLGALGGTGLNTLEPFNPNFVDLRLFCSASTNPIAGWFAIANSGVAANVFGTTAGGALQLIKNSQQAAKHTGASGTIYFQTLTNLNGTIPTPQFIAQDRTVAAGLDTVNGSNAILYALCSTDAEGGSLTIVPIQNAFDSARDIISVYPKFNVTNISNTFAQDVTISANVSGNNIDAMVQMTLVLAKLLGVPATGMTTDLVTAQGVAVAENSELGVDCSSGGIANVVLSSLTTTGASVAGSVSAACTSGTIAPAPAFFTGGSLASVSGTTVIDGSPTVQGEARGILLTEKTATSFNELLNQVGGGNTGTVFEVSLPANCDVVDDRDDNNTAVSAVAGAGGNDVTRFDVTNTGGVTASVAAGGAGNAALTVANVVAPASGTTPAKGFFRISAGNGSATDSIVTDSILFRIDSQDLFCPTTVTGPLTATVKAQNQVSSPTLSSTISSSVNLGTATQALSFGFADHTAMSTKGETSTNSMQGATPRLSGGGTTTSHTFKITELDPRGLPIGGRVSKRNLDPDNTTTGIVVTKGQIWIVPAAGAAFSAAPAKADISFSDDSLTTNGDPVLVASATNDANAPIGSIVIPIKQGTASGAPLPEASTTTVTVANLKLSGATSSTTDLVSSVQFFNQDANVVINTPGVSAGNSASTPTIFTPFAPGSTKGSTQLNLAAAAVVQLGSGSLANSLLTSRLTTLGAPQLNPFATVKSAVQNADSSKITVMSVKASTPEGTTDNVITVTGTAGAVDPGAEVVVKAGGTTTFDEVTVFASDDGSFTANVRGDCSGTNTSVSVTATPQISGTTGTGASKTALCSGETAVDADAILTEIRGEDGTASLDEVLAFVTANGGLAAIISEGGGKLDGLILAAKEALGLS